MGQLDTLEISNLYLLGLLCATLPAYLGIDSVVENIKLYIYSVA